MAEADLAPLHEAGAAPDPFRQFRSWFEEVHKANLLQPDAMTLATATPDGRPSARVVLLRGFDERGFVFFTNYESRKAGELEGNPRAALAMYWPEFGRQVRIEGRVERVAAEESDAYFQSRPRGSQLSAWASPQSQVVRNREFLEERVGQIATTFQDGPVPRPQFWGGYRVIPAVIEFWQGRLNRLHDRLRYLRVEDGGWRIERLGP
jgi:pyridoxamine 5'-phosphate oxidase